MLNILCLMYNEAFAPCVFYILYFVKIRGCLYSTYYFVYRVLVMCSSTE